MNAFFNFLNMTFNIETVKQAQETIFCRKLYKIYHPHSNLIRDKFHRTWRKSIKIF